jgi:flavin-binding protein dodecin
MSDPVYRVTEIVGTSGDSIDHALTGARSMAAEVRRRDRSRRAARQAK